MNIQCPAAGARTGDTVNRAKQVLNGAGSPRLTLCLGLILALTLTLGLCVMVECLRMACYMLDGIVAAAVTWVYWLLSVGVLLFVGLPLFTAVYRMAVLISQHAHETEVTGCEAEEVSLTECLYPFTSPGAYCRTLRVGMEAVAWVCLTVFVPIGLYMACDRMVASATLSSAVSGGMRLCGGGLCAGLSFLFLWCSGYRAGYGWLVFTNPHVSLSDLRMHFRRFRRPRGPVLWLRVRMAGWFILSVLSVGVLFLLHTVPYWMLCAAEYAGGMERLYARCEAPGGSQRICLVKNIENEGYRYKGGKWHE